MTAVRAGSARFRNGKPWVLWVFMAVWMAFLVLFTGLLARDGPPPGYSGPTVGAVLAFFWVAGLGLSWWAVQQRALIVDVDSLGGLDITWYSPAGVRRRRVEARQVEPAEVAERKDSDGDPLFTCRVTLADGTLLDLFEGNDRGMAERVATRFNAHRRR